MDPEELRQLRSEWDDHNYWETKDRRNDFEAPWYWSSESVSEDIGDYEESRDDIGRRERMAEAMYEC